jgi:type II secretory pathway pseudopilin PulG
MMMLFIALLAISALAVMPRIEMQVKRDREEEMIHRGAQYARAIRLYVKKFGRYPTSVSDLLDTNDMRFLRKAYKDPISGKDFRLLHMQDVQALMMGAGGGMLGTGGGIPGAAAGAGQPGMPVGEEAAAPAAAAGNPAQPDNAGAAGSAAGADDSSSQEPGPMSPVSSSSSSSGPSGPVFGGGPIMGVSSISKDRTIRMFNNKDHYNEWLFVYDPTNDRGLITGPYQPPFAGQGIGQPINGNTNGGNTNGTTNGLSPSGQTNTGFGVPTQQNPPSMNQQ